MSTREGHQVVPPMLEKGSTPPVLIIDPPLPLSHTFSSQTMAIKEFYENTDAEDMTQVDRLLWFTKFGLPSSVLVFVIVYWAIGYLKYQSG